MVTNFIMYTRCLFNAYLEWLQILLCICVLIFIFGGGPCYIVVLRGPGAKTGPKWLKTNNLSLI